MKINFPINVIFSGKEMSNGSLEKVRSRRNIEKYPDRERGGGGKKTRLPIKIRNSRNGIYDACRKGATKSKALKSAFVRYK